MDQWWRSVAGEEKKKFPNPNPSLFVSTYCDPPPHPTNYSSLLEPFCRPIPIDKRRKTKMTTATVVSRPLPVLTEGWTAEKDFKPVGKISASSQRSIEPVGPHFLAHARRARHKRTFSEDDRIQAQESAKKVEQEDDGEISEPEDPMMLQREAKDWKVCDTYSHPLHHLDIMFLT